MNLEQYMLERLRSIVNLKGWDYGVVWKLGDDQRFLEWVDCCCGGSGLQNCGEGEGLLFPVSCRDVIIQHPNSISCDLLVQLPSSMPLDSGIYAETLMSNQARWLNFCSNSEYTNRVEDIVGTKVLVPLAFGLVELFVAKQLDRASILGDAIEYVKELQKQVEDLQHELEGNYSDNNTDHDEDIQNSRKHKRSEVFNYQNGNGNHLGLNPEAYEQKSNYDSDNYEKMRQMEPQVEVAQLDGNEYFVKIFCEHKSGGFLRLMEALNSMGLDVTSVNVTSFLSLVSNVLKVERKDSEMVEAGHVRDSLLEITRNSSGGGWPQF